VPQAKPPILPSLRITRWHGTLLKGFLFSAFPTAREARGDPMALAISEYVLILPLGILLQASYTRFSKSLERIKWSSYLAVLKRAKA
jgi:hypothetical protein